MATSSEAFDVDLMKTAELGDQILEELDRLREIESVHWSAATGGWLVTGHADVMRGFSGELPLSVDRLPSIQFSVMSPEEQQRRIPTLLKYIPKWIVSLDPPAHTRQRKLLVKAFNKKAVENVRPYVRERVASLMDEAQQNPDTEFVEGIARQLPGAVILRFIGLPEENVSRLKLWANSFQLGLSSNRPRPEWLETADRAMAEMNELFVREVAEHRQAPREDLLSALLHATEDGETLSDDEMLAALSLLLVAGHDTTHNSITLGVVALSRNPASWTYMRAHPERILDCVNEIMRISAMSAAQARVAVADFELGGKLIKQGDAVFLMQAAGNRDPRVFPRPEKLDFAHDNTTSLTFGPGLHHCVGHLLAKMQLCEFFSQLVQRFDSVEILDDKLDFMPQIVFRGLFKLNVRFHPRQGSVS
jgi:pimeloyl-[acyl-carrier protein] synthase